MSRWVPVLALVLLATACGTVRALPLGDAADIAPRVAAPDITGGSSGPPAVETESKAGPVHVEARASLGLVIPRVEGARLPVDPSPALVPATAPAVVEAIAASLAIVYFARVKAWLLSAGPMALFTRIERKRVLDNATRQRIHDAIEREPGLSVTDIVQVCDVGWGTAVFHLRRLESHGLLASESHRRRRRYFPAGRGIANGTKSAFCELLDPTSKQIAAHVLERPGSAQKDVCEALGLRPSNASKHFAALSRASLVAGQRRANRVHYFPAPQLAELFHLLDAPQGLPDVGAA